MTATQPTIDAMIDNPDLLIKLATQLKDERAKAERSRVIAELQEKEIKEAAPKVEYFDKFIHHHPGGAGVRSIGQDVKR